MNALLSLLRDLFPFEKENRLLYEKHPELITHVIFFDTGHNIHYERPNRFVKEVVNFRETVINHWSK